LVMKEWPKRSRGATSWPTFHVASSWPKRTSGTTS
jgi:hypothetical protein